MTHPTDPNNLSHTVTFSLTKHLSRQANFSARTFGPGPRPKGVIAHIRKELEEIERDPEDIEEWIDVAILAFDGALRQGYSPAEVVDVLVRKQAKNEARKWPDWRTVAPDQPIEHDRTHDAPKP